MQYRVDIKIVLNQIKWKNYTLLKRQFFYLSLKKIHKYYWSCENKEQWENIKEWQCCNIQIQNKQAERVTEMYFNISLCV